MSSFTMSFTSTVRVATQKDAYYPGERVEGAVELEFPREVKVLSVRLKLVGKEKTNVTADSVHSQRTNEFVYGVTSTEYTYVRSATTLFGKRGAYDDDAFIRMQENEVPLKRISTLRAKEPTDGAEEAEVAPHRVLSQLLTNTIPAGKYVFPFALDLPLDIPPTYTTRTRTKDGPRSQSNSALTYYVRLYVNSSVTWCSYGEFKVLSIPINPKLPLCVSASAGRLVKCKFPLSTCGCFGGSNLNAAIKLETGKFTIGKDPIRVAIKITNAGSNNNVEKLTLSLVQRIAFSTTEARVSTEDVVFSAAHSVGIRSASKIEFSNAESVIPATDSRDSPMLPTMKTNGVDVAYDLVVELSIRHCSDAKHVFKDILLVSPPSDIASHLASTIVFSALERNKLTNLEAMYTVPECPCVAPLLPPDPTEGADNAATAPPTSDC